MKELLEFLDANKEYSVTVDFVTPETVGILDPANCRRPEVVDPIWAPPSKFYSSPIDAVKTFVSTREKRQWFTSQAHRPYADLLIDHYGKISRQGGAFPTLEQQFNVLEYYRSPRHSVESRCMRVGLEVLLTVIREAISRYGYPQVEYQYTRMSTFSGYPAATAKNTIQAYLTAETGKPIVHTQPALPGQRRMRGKDRSIFMVANSDFQHLEPMLKACRLWLRQWLPDLFGAWLNPDLIVKPSIDEALRRRFLSVEIDYITMDINFTYDIVVEYLYPVYELLLPQSFIGFASMVEDTFRTPLLWHDSLWHGWHTLFSGVCPTNDFETLYSVIQALGALVLAGVKQRKLLSLGDDQTILIPQKYKHCIPRLRDVLLENAAQTGMRLHDDEKFRISADSVRFCRNVYYAAGRKAETGLPLGAYPSILSVMNIMTPEKPSPTPCSSAAADLQRLDNVYGSIDFYELCDFVASRRVDRFRISREDVSDAVEWDWWCRLYGEVWDPSFSPAFTYLWSRGYFRG